MLDAIVDLYVGALAWRWSLLMAIYPIAVLAIVGGFAWLLRGGFYSDLRMRLGFAKAGTDEGRFVGAALLVGASVLVRWDWTLLVLWPFVVAAMKKGYLGEAMGIERGLRDVALMSLWGALVFSIALAPLYGAVAIVGDPWPIAIVVESGIGFAAFGLGVGPVYAANKRLGRRLGLDWTERAEIGVGALLGASVALAGVQ